MNSEAFPSDEFVQSVIDAFQGDPQNADKNRPADDVLAPVIRSLAQEMMLFERSLGRLTPDIDLVWVVSGPGTWYRERKEDRYARYAWSGWMDRHRIEMGVRVVRAVAAERIFLTRPSFFSQRDLDAAALMVCAPRLFYNGRPDEVADFRRAVEGRELGIPRDLVQGSDGFAQHDGGWQPIETSVHNARSFHVAASVLHPRCVAVVSHAPQLSRILRILNNPALFPSGMRLRLFPVPTPVEGREEYMRRDIQSALAAHFILKEAALDPYPYEL